MTTKLSNEYKQRHLAAKPTTNNKYPKKVTPMTAIAKLYRGQKLYFRFSELFQLKQNIKTKFFFQIFFSLLFEGNKCTCRNIASEGWKILVFPLLLSLRSVRNPRSREFYVVCRRTTCLKSFLELPRLSLSK